MIFSPPCITKDGSNLKSLSSFFLSFSFSLFKIVPSTKLAKRSNLDVDNYTHVQWIRVLVRLIDIVSARSLHFLSNRHSAITATSSLL